MPTTGGSGKACAERLRDAGGGEKSALAIRRQEAEPDAFSVFICLYPAREGEGGGSFYAVPAVRNAMVDEQ